MRGKWLLAAGCAVIAGVGAGALSHRRKPAPPPPATAAAVLNLNELTIPGAIRAQHVAGVGATIEGNIEAFLADVGDEVYEGQVLARIGSAGLETEREQAQAGVDRAQQQVSAAEAGVASARMEASRAEADLTRARNQMEQAQKVYERQTTLHKAGATPKLKFEAAERDYRAAVEEFDVMDKAARAGHEAIQSANEMLAAAKKRLDESTDALETAQGAFEAAEVRAPVAGVIVGRKGETGKSARDFGEQLFEIATDLFALEAVAEPRPDDLKQLHPGQQAMVVVLDLQSAGMPGVVRAIKDNQAIVEFTAAMPGLKPGMRADIRVKLD
jgi:multidrug resistance efflux pump